MTIDELGLEIHFVKENVILAPDSRSSEKFMHGIKVLMAKNYIDNLSEETRKGMLEKARQGIWPSFAPLGYINVDGANGKRTIVPDLESGAGHHQDVRAVRHRQVLAEADGQDSPRRRAGLPEER